MAASAAERFLPAIAGLGTTVQCRGKKTVFSQGDPGDAVFFVQAGKVKLSVVSERGRVAVIAMLGVGDFFGEGCLAGQSHRMATATTLTDCTLLRFDRRVFVGLLRKQSGFAERFLAHVLSRNIRFEEDLVDQLFNSSEKRLARMLLLLARFGKEDELETIIPRISQETLAQMIGSTRSRVNFFLNKFRKLGFIEYKGRLKVHSSLLNVALRD